MFLLNNGKKLQNHMEKPLSTIFMIIQSDSIHVQMVWAFSKHNLIVAQNPNIEILQLQFFNYKIPNFGKDWQNMFFFNYQQKINLIFKCCQYNQKGIKVYLVDLQIKYINVSSLISDLFFLIKVRNYSVFYIYFFRMINLHN